MARGCLAPAFAPRKGGIKALRFKANAQAVKNRRLSRRRADSGRPVWSGAAPSNRKASSHDHLDQKRHAQNELEKIVDKFEKQGLDVTLITGKDYNVFGLVGDTTKIDERTCWQTRGSTT